MAEAVKDLPDPLEEPLNPEAGPSPDDLLSKLADQAISQLIDDSEKGVTSVLSPILDPEPIADPTPTPVAEPTQTIEAPVVTPDTAPPVHTETEIAAEDVQAQLDTVLNELKSDAPIPPPEPVIPEISEPIPDTAPVVSQPDSRADIKALFDPVETPAPIRRKPPAVIVKPLEWINFPFTSLPDSVRDTLGQIGIVTLINALAVLLYVIVFKK